MYKGQIPFNRHTGDHCSYYGGPSNRDGYEWRDNVPFKADLRIDTYSRGQSAANFEAVDAEGRKYNLFLSDMLDIVKSCGIEVGGRIPWSDWVFCKRGSNYGITRFVKKTVDT
jgi:hypothetical protein